MTWANVDRRDIDQTVHTWPLHDTKPHVLHAREKCPCNPRVLNILSYENVQIVHNSFDGREALE